MTDQTRTATRQRTRTTITKDNMTAMLVLYPPQSGEPELTLEDVLREVDAAGVVHSVDHAVIEEALNNKVFNTPIKAATGTPPEKGENAELVYTFDTSNHHSPKEDADGRIDYRDMNFIQNTTAGTVLVTKKPPTPGVAGKSVLGKEIPPADGRDFPFKPGPGTKVSDDGLSLIATAEGAIVFRAGEVSVKDVLPINGDVDISVGNLDCRGSIKISGQVNAGFRITVDGNVEVGGNVEDSTILAKGNILVKGGFFGNGSGHIEAEGDITVKFAEGQKMVAGGDIFVGGELINCNITAKGNVWVKGKQGKIVGGEVKAGKEIRASVLGSESGTPTNLIVAYDAQLWQKYHHTIKEIARLKADSERIKEVLYGLVRLEMDGKLSPDKKKALDQLQKFHKDLPDNLLAMQNQKTEIEEKMKELRDARIIAEETIYPGVRAHFGIVYREILEEVKGCKLTMEGSQVMMSDLKNH